MILEMVFDQFDCAGRRTASYLIEQVFPSGEVFVREWLYDPDDGRVIFRGRPVGAGRARRIVDQAVGRR